MNSEEVQINFNEIQSLKYEESCAILTVLSLINNSIFIYINIVIEDIKS